MKKQFGTKLMAVAASVAIVASLAACSGQNGNSAEQTQNKDLSLTIGQPAGALAGENHNPKGVNSTASKLGYTPALYEPMGIVNLADPTQDVIPWLASKIEWSDDYSKVNLTAREGDAAYNHTPFLGKSCRKTRKCSFARSVSVRFLGKKKSPAAMQGFSNEVIREEENNLV